MIDMEEILKSLSLDRMIFHSEADFQHALAMKIAQLFPAAKIRLEIPFTIENSRLKLDILTKVDKQVIAIELKYATSKHSILCDNEPYDLRDQSADDLLRYNYCKDIQRLELLIANDYCSIGYAVILSNYAPFWKEWSPSLNKHVNDFEFRIHEGKVIHGELKWGPNTKPKYILSPLQINGRYSMVWKDYSNAISQKKDYSDTQLQK